MDECVRFLISVRVQGVFYRGSTRTKARELGLRGLARNLTDGRVEVVACGPAERIAALERWLWQGPRLAEVTDVTRAAYEDEQDFFDFETE